MKSIYNTPGFSEELLLVCASLREVGQIGRAHV